MPLRTSLYRKQTSGRWSSRNSRRREVLSVNMISLPLADFRHITHIGNDAHRDSFGDLSFLKNGHSLMLKSSQSEQNLFMACSPPPKPPRLNVDETDGSESPDWSACRQLNTYQKRKKSNSMPLLDSDDVEEIEEDARNQKENNGSRSQALNPDLGSVASEKDTDSAEMQCENTETQKEEESNFSFSLDLGPSILDDVLQVMDKLHC